MTMSDLGAPAAVNPIDLLLYYALKGSSGERCSATIPS